MYTVLTALLCTLITIIACFIYKAWRTNMYWKKKGVPHIEPVLFLGNMVPLMRNKLTIGEFHEYLCKQLPNEPYIGVYDYMKTTLIVRDVDLVEKILIKDFAHFVDHGMPLDEEKNPLDSNLFAMCGKRWKAVRNKLSPIFTTGKLKMMHETMEGCGNELIKMFEKNEKNTDIEMKDIFERFAMDTIGSCAFGIDAGSMSKPENEFRRMGKKVLEMDNVTLLKAILFFYFPIIRKLFNLTFSKPHVVKYFANVIKSTLKYRRENNFKRNDFIQLLMQLQDKGYVEMHTKDSADDYLEIDSNTYTLEKFDLTDEQLTGHAVTFLTAGFDAITSSMLYTLYEFTKNQEIQEKVREEVLNILKQQNGSLNYDALKGMVYLEQCVKETMRKYPAVQLLMRVCTKEYTFPNGYTIQPGEIINIPVKAIHYDPKYYPEPELFNPERFDPDRTIPSCAYLPFGNGPRICIGMRFALLEIKYCLAKLLMNYKFTLSSKTKEPITLNNRSFLTTPTEPLYFNYSKILT